MSAYSTIDLESESANDVSASKSQMGQTRKAVGLAVVCSLAFVAGAAVPSAAKGLSNLVAATPSDWPHQGKGPITIVKKDWMSYENKDWCLTAHTVPPVAGENEHIQVKKCRKGSAAQEWLVYDNNAFGNDYAGRVQLTTPDADGVNYCLEIQCDDLHGKPCDDAKVKLKPCSDLKTASDDDYQNIVYAPTKGVLDKLKFQALDAEDDVFGEYHLCLGTGREAEEDKEKEESIAGMRIKSVPCGDEKFYDHDIDGDVYWHVDGNFD